VTAIQHSKPVMTYGPRVLMTISPSGHAFFVGVACDSPLVAMKSDRLHHVVAPRKLDRLAALAIVKSREGWGT